MHSTNSKKPLRVGVFKDVTAAERAVKFLGESGFSKDEIAIVCSQSQLEKMSNVEVNVEKPNSHTGEAAAAGGVLGATIAGLIVSATAIITGGVSLVVAGAASLAAGAIVGSFTGLMIDRGMQPDLADYYDQAVRAGRILVAVEVDSFESEGRLVEAERAFERAGAEPVALTEAHSFRE